MTSIIDPASGSCPLPHPAGGTVLLGHGSGGRLSEELLREVFLPALSNPFLEKLNDQAIVPLAGESLAFTTDSFVVDPIFFPGGDIGSLAVNGTVNDLAVGGARPLYLSAAFILEEGLPMAHLRRIVASMQAACQAAGVMLVTGDTKVVGRGKGDGVFITTSGVGAMEPGNTLSVDRARPGDRVILSGGIGEHGIAILSVREDPQNARGQRGRAPDARPDARRRREHAQRDRPGQRRRHRDRRGEHSDPRRGAGRLRTAGPRSAVRGQRRQVHRRGRGG